MTRGNPLRKIKTSCAGLKPDLVQNQWPGKETGVLIVGVEACVGKTGGTQCGAQILQGHGAAFAGQRQGDALYTAEIISAHKLRVVAGGVARIDIGMRHIIEFQILRKYNRRFGEPAFIAQRLNLHYGFLEAVKVGYEKSRGGRIITLRSKSSRLCTEGYAKNKGNNDR